MSDHKLPGEFVYQGCHYDSLVTSTKMLDGVGKLSLSPQDTIVATYAKSGTIWMKFMTYLILHDGVVPDDLPTSEKRHLEFRFPGEIEEEVLADIEKRPPPRFFSSHVHFRFIEKQVTEDKVKVIVVMRNVKDALVSMYHFARMCTAMGNFPGTWDEFFELFKKKCLWGGDIFDFNVGWWAVRDLENVFITTFEEMKRNREGTVRDVAKFLGKSLSEDVVQKIVDETSFAKMKDNTLVNGADLASAGLYDFSKAKFMRKGKVGDFDNYFSDEQNQYVDNLYDERCKPIGLSFEESL